MRRFFLLTLLTVVAISVNAQRKIRKLEVEEKGFSVSLNYKAETDEIEYNGLRLKITPLSASSLNNKFFKESFFNGNLEYSHYEKSRNSYFLKKQKRKPKKSDLEFLFEGVDWLFDNNKINSDEKIKLTKQIVFNYNYEKGKTIYNVNKIILSNPYYIGDKYLNVFEIEISNTTNTYKKFNKRFLIETGNLLLHPITTKEIVETLEQYEISNQNKVQTLIRYNLSDEIIIPPNSKFIKYFATVPIDYNNDDLKISFDGLNSKFRWIINKKYDSFDNKYTFFEFSIDWDYNDYSSSIGDNFCILEASSNIYLANETVYVGEKELNDEFELISISLYSDKLYFGRTKFKGADYIELDKNRRKKLLVDLSLINELEKKIKK